MMSDDPTSSLKKIQAEKLSGWSHPDNFAKEENEEERINSHAHPERTGVRANISFDYPPSTTRGLGGILSPGRTSHPGTVGDGRPEPKKPAFSPAKEARAARAAGQQMASSGTAKLRASNIEMQMNAAISIPRDAPTIYEKYSKKMLSLDDLYNEYCKNKKEIVTLLCESTGMETAKGRVQYSGTSTLVVQAHMIPRIVAWPLVIYIMIKQEHKKTQIARAVVKAYLNLQPQERYQFMLSCKTGLDLDTIMLIIAAGDEAPEAAGMDTLDPSMVDEEHAVEGWETLWLCVGFVCCWSKQDIEQLEARMREFRQCRGDHFTRCSGPGDCWNAFVQFNANWQAMEDECATMDMEDMLMPNALEQKDMLINAVCYDEPMFREVMHHLKTRSGDGNGTARKHWTMKMIMTSVAEVEKQREDDPVK